MIFLPQKYASGVGSGEKLMGGLHAQEGNQQEIIKREKLAPSIT
jgi:hypothetical protein